MEMNKAEILTEVGKLEAAITILNALTIPSKACEESVSENVQNDIQWRRSDAIQLMRQMRTIYEELTDECN